LDPKRTKAADVRELFEDLDGAKLIKSKPEIPDDFLKIVDRMQDAKGMLESLQVMCLNPNNASEFVEANKKWLTSDQLCLLISNLLIFFMLEHLEFAKTMIKLMIETDKAHNGKKVTNNSTLGILLNVFSEMFGKKKYCDLFDVNLRNQIAHNQYWWDDYQFTYRKNGQIEKIDFDTFIELVKERFKTPFIFEPYHKKIRHPFDYYKFGIDFLRPLVDLPHSTVSGLIHLDYITTLIKKKENVILFANHQIEADPQAISILLEKMHPKFSEELIFVAGTRVTSDPLAVPFSMGRNLLCIHSKKYIDNPPDKKHEKQMHNKRTMERMVELLAEGGHAIYVAPSGGRDRANQDGIVEVARFDPQSIEMFYLMAQKGKTPTHFFPLALSTYHLLPPPEAIDIELGETRITRGGAIHIHFGKEVDMKHFPGAEKTDNKKDRRGARAEYLWNCVKKEYEKFPQ